MDFGYVIRNFVLRIRDNRGAINFFSMDFSFQDMLSQQNQQIFMKAHIECPFLYQLSLIHELF